MPQSNSSTSGAPSTALCKAQECDSPAEGYTPNRLLSLTVFGPKGGQIVDGYCVACQESRIKNAWYGLVAIIVAVVMVLATVFTLGQ